MRWANYPALLKGSRQPSTSASYPKAWRVASEIRGWQVSWHPEGVLMTTPKAVELREVLYRMAAWDTSNSRRRYKLFAEIHNTVKNKHQRVSKASQQIKPRSDFVSLANLFCGFIFSLTALL